MSSPGFYTCPPTHAIMTWSCTTAQHNTIDRAAFSDLLCLHPMGYSVHWTACPEGDHLGAWVLMIRAMAMGQVSTGLHVLRGITLAMAMVCTGLHVLRGITLVGPHDQGHGHGAGVHWTARPEGDHLGAWVLMIRAMAMGQVSTGLHVLRGITLAMGQVCTGLHVLPEGITLVGPQCT